MKSDCIVIDTFQKRGLAKKRITFRLIQDDTGRFHIQRDEFTIIFFSKERQARMGFEMLKGGSR